MENKIDVRRKDVRCTKDGRRSKKDRLTEKSEKDQAEPRMKFREMDEGDKI